MYREGQTATNPKTGQRVIFRDGQWRLATGATGGGKKAFPAESFRRASDTASAIDDAQRRTNVFRTGMIGGWTQGIPGSPAFNLDKDLDTLKARTAFDELAAMRKASPTGAALGAVSDTEMRLLQAAEANLDVGQSESQIDKNLGRMRQTVVARNPGVSIENPVDLNNIDPATLPDAAYFRGPDGVVYRQKRGAGAPGSVRGGRGGPPPGVSAAEWSAMTPQERALFK
jgi:hypothetical protein